jgi:magnesium transporter
MKSTEPDARHSKDTSTRSDSEQIIQALESGKNKRVRKLLGRMHPAKVAAMLELLEDEPRMALWQQIDPAREGRVLPHLSIKLRRQLAGESADAQQSKQDATPESGQGEINHLEAIRDPWA